MGSAVSAREAEVLDLLGSHLTHAEIATQLVVSIRTVESHVASLRRKLDIPGHRDLVRYAATRRRGTAAPAAPAAVTSFVGRVRERAELAQIVAVARVVSVVGAGGVGKTRLARAVADDLVDRFPDGVWFTDLVPVQDDAGLAAAVAAACGTDDVPGRDATEALVRGIGSGHALLVLDNCEHVVNGVAGLVERLLPQCPNLHLFVTSRARLVLAVERVYRLTGFSAEGEARALFVDRAVAAGWPAPNEAQLARADAICAALDGFALAIELAAVRLPALGLDGIEAALEDQATLLVANERSEPRHRSMQDTLEWSYRLLGRSEQAALRRAAVFASAFDLSAARAVLSFGELGAADVAPALARLVDQSLLVSMPDGGWRLLEPVRQFAQSRMDDTDRAAYELHLSWVRAGLDTILAAGRMSSRDWYAELDDLADDARAAVRWAESDLARHADAAEVATRLATALFRSGRSREALARYERAAELSVDVRRSMELLGSAAAVAKCLVRGEDAQRLERASIELARGLGDPAALADALAQAAGTMLRFGGMFADAPSVPDALAMLDEAGARSPLDPRDPADPHEALATARGSGDTIRISAALDALTAQLVAAGRPVAAGRCAVERVRLFGRGAADPVTALELKDALHMAVLTSLGAGDLDAARRFAQRQGELPFLREQRDVAIDETLAPHALAGRWDDLDAAAESWLADWTAGGRHPGAGRAISAAAVSMAHGLRGDEVARAQWRGITAEMRGVHPDDATTGTGYGAVFDALVLLDRDLPGQALERLRSESDADEWYGRLFCQWHAALVADAAVRCRDPQAPELCADAAVIVSGNPVATAILARAQQPQV